MSITYLYFIHCFFFQFVIHVFFRNLKILKTAEITKKIHNLNSEKFQKKVISTMQFELNILYYDSHICCFFNLIE